MAFNLGYSRKRFDDTLIFDAPIILDMDDPRFKDNVDMAFKILEKDIKRKFLKHYFNMIKRVMLRSNEILRKYDEKNRFWSFNDDMASKGFIEVINYNERFNINFGYKAPQAFFVHYGINPGTFPNLDMIRKFLDRHVDGVRIYQQMYSKTRIANDQKIDGQYGPLTHKIGRDMKSFKDQLAYLIGKSIEEKGIKPVKFLDWAFKDERSFLDSEMKKIKKYDFDDKKSKKLTNFNILSKIFKGIKNKIDSLLDEFKKDKTEFQDGIEITVRNLDR